MENCIKVKEENGENGQKDQVNEVGSCPENVQEG